MTLSNPVAASLGTQTSTTVTITDDDVRNAGTLALSNATVTLSEGGPAITVTVDRTGGSDGTVTVDYATADVTATAPGDYTALNGTLTFLEGEISKTLTLTPTNDATWEPSEEFTLTLSNVVDATLGTQTSTTVTITDDDTRTSGTLALSSASATLSESGPAITLTVDRTGGSDGTVSVDYVTVNGTATAPGDYTALNGSLTFLNGELSKTLTLTPANDATWEPSETFTLTLGNVVDASLGLSTTTVTIADDDTRNAGTLALSTATESVAENAAGGITLTVSRTGGTDGPVSVDYATANGTAASPGDYTATSGTLNFLHGETSKTIPLTLTNDTTWEPSEEFTVTLGNVVDATLGTQTSTTVTITDDDTRNAGTLALNSTTVALPESGPAVIMTVNRTGGSDGTVSVDYATADGTATAPGDYTAINGTLIFLNGETSKTVTLTPINDTTWEPSEDFTLTLSNPVDASLGLATATVTISDDDTRTSGTLALSSATATLSGSGPAITLTVDRTGGSDGTVTVDYATADGTATAAGDYTAISGTLTFLDGELSKPLTLTPTGDTVWEPSEGFTLNLSNPVEASLGLAAATVTITDDDTRNAGTLALNSTTVTLPESGPAVIMTVNRTGGSDGTVSVDYATADGTATAPGDYTAINGTLIFLNGETSKTIPLTPIDDATWEPSETFTLTLSNPVDASLGLSTATVTITDDDPRSAGTLALSSPTATLSESGPAITLTVDRTGGSDGTVSVDYETMDGTATAPGDYTTINGTLTFLDGELSKTLTLNPTGDTVWEPSETFTLILSNAVDASLGLATATVTITDDDTRNAGTLALNSTTVTLPESGPAVIMTVNRTGGSDGTVMVDYATADGTATAPGDYTAISGTLIFLNGETSKTVTLTPINDTTWEPSEVFTLTLSNPVDASLGLATATVTISDDDARTSGTLALSSATATLSESGPAITLTVDRTGGSDGTVSVDYATVDGTATAPGDYTAINGTLTFLDGELSKTLTLIPTGDTVWEPSETFTLILSNAVDASLGLATATVTITDDDTRNAGTLALNSTTVTLPESGPAVIMTVNRTGGSDGTVTVDYATADGTATAPGDYTAISGTLIFLNGETSKTVTLTPINDTTWEPSEDFTLTLSNPVDATLGLATATVTVTDDDPRSAGTLDLSNAIATLSESGPAVMLTVDRTGGSDGTVSVDYATTDGTATAPGDYTAINGTLTFLDGELSKTLTLNPTGDTIWEPSETFTLSLSNPVDATLGLASATVTITDDDDGVAPVITIQEPVISVPSTGPFTSVDLGVVTALDDVDGVVTPVADLTGPFAPGRHLITWRAMDSSSNMASEVQTVDVLPMVNFGIDQLANPGSTVDIPVFLNGDAPEYPVVIDYQITDFDAAGGTVAQTAGSVNIAAGAVPSNQANIQYLIQNAGVAKVEVTSLNTGANATFGANNVHTINVNVTEMNLPPVVSITGSQNNTTTATVFADAGQVTVTAVVNDPNPADTHVYDWSQSDNGLALQFGAQPNTVVFDPSGLIEGVYKVVVSVTDFAGDTTTVDKSVRVRASALIFDDDGSDSDSDGVSDFDEGDEDEDEDGIPDYLDPHDDDYILAGQNGDPDDFLLITEPGLKLELSEEKIRDEDYSADLDEQEFIDRENSSGGGVGDPQDTHAHVGGIFEFEIEGLAYVGQSVRIVIPVHEAIPANAVYRLYTDDEGWHDFVVDDRNSVSSAPGELGICPAPGDVTYIAGLHEGRFCVQLLIEDGGRNDADRRANGEIEDPGGVAIVPTSTPTTPQTSSGGGGGIGGWLLVLLLGVWLRNIRRESMTGIRLSAVKLVGGGFRTLLLAGLLSAGMVSTVSSANGLLSLYEASADSVAATLKPDCAFHAQGEAADKEREFPTIVGGVRSEENQLRYRQVIASSKGYRRSEHNYRMPERKLVSMDGQATSLATELEGDKPVMLNFIFTTCTTICPVLSATFSQVRESLGAESRNVTMVSISIDPEYDTPERLNEYARLYGADDQWRFLTGRVEDIIAIEKAFDAYRGTKMSHEPLTFLRADGDSPWVRIEGIASADDIVKEYEQLVLR
ncbi:MAG: SCO family protein [gamma proteobacterium endosymbiont of Lamellibrachia anaximandri]|nr:SCO family protein [gamma proteobacterium endosymbiont of Lamellibrachia anaximandri]MBL3534001.1 SCO family protein [gamma proteobacterium endosymbiont of Lamellibrachia anaximandri]